MLNCRTFFLFTEIFIFALKVYFNVVEDNYELSKTTDSFEYDDDNEQVSSLEFDTL